MWRYRFSSLTALLLLVGFADANPKIMSGRIRASDDTTQFQILHTNDMHGRFDQTSQTSGICSDSDAASNKCYGGMARIATLVRNARAGSIPTLYLDAGDTYQGTIWFIAHKWEIIARFLNILKPDAMSLGNHEFDNGVAGLVPFIKNATFPILSANLDLTNEPELDATNLAKSTVIDVNGTKVGIIGYLTPETKFLSSTGNVIFEDEIAAISEEAKRLKESGVNILIALGHSGFTVDKKIASEVADIDLVIGGHTNTFLYNGSQPDSEVPRGLYPTEVIQSSGRVVYVVQAYAYTKYLGNLSLTFDSEGELTHIEGNPILVDSSIEQATDVLAELDNWRPAITNLTEFSIGTTRVLLNGDGEACRRRECNLGNLITDALVDYNSRHYTGSDGWTDAAISVINSGNIRTSISTNNDNKITMADVLSVLPFGNQALAVSMTGRELLSMLEWSVYYMTGDPNEDARGAFLQFSGIQVLYDLSQPANSKVVSVQVRCAKCNVPVYTDLNKTETYSVITNDYMYTGGDGYSMLVGLPYKSLDASLSDIVVDYLQLRSPVYPAVEWRITFTEPESDTAEQTSGASHVTFTLIAIVLPFIIRSLT